MKKEAILDTEAVWCVRMWLMATCSQIESRVFARDWRSAVAKAVDLIADGIEYKILSVGQDISD